MPLVTRSLLLEVCSHGQAVGFVAFVLEEQVHRAAHEPDPRVVRGDEVLVEAHGEDLDDFLSAEQRDVGVRALDFVEEAG